MRDNRVYIFVVVLDFDKTLPAALVRQTAVKLTI
jgi:hypothetical protein